MRGDEARRRERQNISSLPPFISTIFILVRSSSPAQKARRILETAWAISRLSRACARVGSTEGGQNRRHRIDSTEEETTSIGLSPHPKQSNSRPRLIPISNFRRWMVLVSTESILTSLLLQCSFREHDHPTMFVRIGRACSQSPSRPNSILLCVGLLPSPLSLRKPPKKKGRKRRTGLLSYFNLHDRC